MMKNLPAAAFFDVDGTLYDHKNNEIPTLHLQALKKLQEKGVKVCLCTGRAMPLLENLGILPLFDWDGIVAGNGAYVYDKEGTVLYENCIDPSVVRQIFDQAKKEDVSLFVAGNTTYTTDLKPNTKKLLDDFHVKDIPTRWLEEQDRLCIVCIALDYPSQRKESFENFPGIRSIRQTYAYDLVIEDLSKFHGIQVLLNHYGIDEHDYIGFGDSFNDVEMLENAKIGVVMENAAPDLLKQFENHAPAVHEAGIYTYLLENGYIEE